MKRFLYTLVTVLGISAPAALLAQQDAMHAQNILNHLRINPAYAGYKETPTVSAFHRSQWIGFKGAPSTQTVSFDAPLKRSKFSLGGSITHDKIGPISTLTIMGDAAARVQVSRKGFVSFGLKATGSLLQANFTDVALVSGRNGEIDELFAQNARSMFMPNVGFGFFFSDPDHFISLSIPRLLSNRLRTSAGEMTVADLGILQQVGYFSAGKMFKIDRTFKFQPALMVRAQQNAPISIGVNGNLIIADAIKAGVFYYYKEVAGAFIQYDLDKRLKIGYSLDLATNRLITTNFGSHEIMVSYMVKEKRRRIVYPRYF
ncbi:MAG: type IX secretion system membrane protein PorP/SprF [Flavobacteriales bacterium]|jgi:type IX secretion system PorP/SprF family membrane protein